MPPRISALLICTSALGCGLGMVSRGATSGSSSTLGGASSASSAGSSTGEGSTGASGASTTATAGTTVGTTGAGTTTATTSGGSQTSSVAASSGTTQGISTGGGASATDGGVTYDQASACINGMLYRNDGLPSRAAAPHGEGEFDLDGLDRGFWGGVRTRTEQVPNSGNSWGPGFTTSWGRFQYDTYFGDWSDDGGYDPFFVGVDTAAPGHPQGLRIEALINPLKGNPHYGSGWTATSSTAAVIAPSDGGSVQIPVVAPDSAHLGWAVGIGREDDDKGVIFIGTLTAGGCTVQSDGSCSGGTSPWTVSGVQVYEGAGASSPSGTDVQAWDFPDYYSGVLDTNLTQQYGFFVARLRLPKPAPALSPAWWMLETGGVGLNGGQLLRSEWDIEEQFANDYGYDLNAGNILWNSGSPGISYGCGMSCAAPTEGATGVYAWPSTGDYSSDYHDYGVLVSPGGPAFPTDYLGAAGGNFVENNSPFSGTTFYLDGQPVAGHVGQPDLSQGSGDKELMVMFQVAAPLTWLDANGTGPSNAWPLYFWSQWLRVYTPTQMPCP